MLAACAPLAVLFVMTNMCNPDRKVKSELATPPFSTVQAKKNSFLLESKKIFGSYAFPLKEQIPSVLDTLPSQSKNRLTTSFLPPSITTAPT